MTLDSFLEQAWNDHADKPQEVADRVAASLELVTAPDHVPRYAALLSHVYGEHLGQWKPGVELLESMRGKASGGDAGAAAQRSLDRNVAALRYAGGDGAAMDSLVDEDRVSALGAASSMFTGRNEFKRAIATYAEALRAAETGLPAGSVAVRSLAIGGNNLAAALEGKKDRDAVETAGMVSAARSALKYWKLAGTWLEEERAEYRLARSLMQAGDARAAVDAAQRCLAVCERNEAPAFERFFAHAVLALAQRAAGDAASFEASRAQALKVVEEVPADERKWCEAELRELAD